jgi:hypothetical protein
MSKKDMEQIPQVVKIPKIEYQSMFESNDAGGCQCLTMRCIRTDFLPMYPSYVLYAPLCRDLSHVRRAGGARLMPVAQYNLCGRWLSLRHSRTLRHSLHFWRVEFRCLKRHISFVNTAVAVAFGVAFAAITTVRSPTLAHSLLTCTGTWLPGSLNAVALKLDFTSLKYLSLRLLNT